jgi:hypothetical protein
MGPNLLQSSLSLLVTLTRERIARSNSSLWTSRGENCVRYDASSGCLHCPAATKLLFLGRLSIASR